MDPPIVLDIGVQNVYLRWELSDDLHRWFVFRAQSKCRTIFEWAARRQLNADSPHQNSSGFEFELFSTEPFALRKLDSLL